MSRDRALDLGKGLAILFVYLGHSVLYHPIQMVKLYPWCDTLDNFITSFNMPLFFIISGYLFSKTRKTSKELYMGKTKRILIPYLTTMAIIIGMKLILPGSMSFNSAVGGGIKALFINALCYGGDCWFVYTLYIMFLILIPIRFILKNKVVDLAIVALLTGVYFINILPDILALDKVFYFMIFFVVGYAMNDRYLRVKQWALKWWWVIYLIFVLANILIIGVLCEITLLFRFILPITGSLAIMTMAFQLEKIIDNSKMARKLSF